MVANINLIKQESYSVVNLEKQLSNTSIEKLNVLTRHIFNVNNEEDVLKLINWIITYYMKRINIS